MAAASSLPKAPATKPSISKLTSIEALPPATKKLYQREQRTREKDRFREELSKRLGSKFLSLAETFRMYGLQSIRDFIEPDVFSALTHAYDEKIIDRSGSARSSAFGFTFHNFVNDKDFLLNPVFKEAFFHPLILALVAYAMGGPVRLVDARGKNAEPGLTMVRDNGPHVDDNPFNDEWKLLISWLVDAETGVSYNKGPQGQAFIAVPGTEKLVRRDATEYGANFKNPLEFLEVLQEQAGKQDIFFVESKDERPLFSLFEASHQIHHRKRSPSEPARGCVIFSYHLVDEESKPGSYFKKTEEKAVEIKEPLERFLLSGEKSEEELHLVNEYFIRILEEKKAELDSRINILEEKKRVIPPIEKMMDPEALVAYIKLLIKTYKLEYLESKVDLRFKEEEFKSPELMRKKLRETIGEADKHYDLDLKIYADKREQIRKVPRTLLRESGSDKVSRERFDKLHIPDKEQKPLMPIEFKEYASSFSPFANNLCEHLSALISNTTDDAKSLLLLLKDDSSKHSDIDLLSKRLLPKEKELLELYQLAKDMGDAFQRCDDMKSLRAHAYFLYLIYDKIYQISPNEMIDKSAQELLQRYFNLVVKDDFTYKLSMRSMEVSDHELAGKLANVKVNNHGTVCKFGETDQYRKMLKPRELTGESHLFSVKVKTEEKKLDDTVSESCIAKAILMEATSQPVIQKHLGEVADILNTRIIIPLLENLDRAEWNINLLPEYFKKMMEYFINENSTKANQRLGIMRAKPPKEISDNKELLKELILRVQHNLLRIKKEPVDFEVVDRCIKSVSEISWCYVEQLPASMKSPNYNFFRDCIMASPQESLARVTHEEASVMPMLSTATGINRADLVATHSAPPSAFLAGKSMFLATDSLLRLRVEAKKLEEAKKKWDELIIKRAETKSINEAKLVYEKQLKFMTDNKMPLDAKEAKLSTIEKVARLASPEAPYPLVAGYSASGARMLLALNDMGFFGRGDSFDFDKEKIVANCILGGLVHGGHHSYIELIEPHNRLLAAVGINALEEKNLPLAARCQDEQFPVIDLPRDKRMEFIHPSYRDSVKDKAAKLQDEILPAARP